MTRAAARLWLLPLVLASPACSENTAPRPGAPAALAAIAGTGQEAIAGEPLRDALAVRVTDAAGAPLSGVTVTWSASTGAGSVAPHATATDDAGETRAGWRLGTTAGQQHVTAKVDGIAPVTFSAEAKPGPPAALARVSTDPQQGAVGQTLAPLVVRLQDEFGNGIAGATVTWSVAAGSGSVTPATVQTGPTGTASTSWTLGSTLGTHSVSASAQGVPAVAFTATATTNLEGRWTTDRPDEVAGPQVHVIYVVPSDGADRGLDTSGTLARSVASFHTWFSQHSNGLAIRFDTYHGGKLDITFFRLSRTDAQMQAFGAFVVTQIEQELQSAGRLSSEKRYLVYYDGGSTYACGGAAWPPNVPGRVAAMYLRGTPGGVQCASQTFVASATDFPRYWEFAALHDLIHTLGIVSTNAPNHTSAYPAHVPESNDLMYSGPAPWNIGSAMTIDVRGDDYHGPNVPAGVARLTSSPFITTVPLASLPALRPLSALAATRLAEDATRLPVHPPFPRPHAHPEPR